jgi:hypothetical protein
MSTNIQGNQANVHQNRTATVAAIANNGSGAWRVTTSPAHLFGNHDFVALAVTISAVVVYVAGFVTVIDATHFDVAGTTFTATGTGTATDYSLTPAIQYPTDGDPFTVQLSGLLSAFKGMADRTQLLRYLLLTQEGRLVNVTASGNVPIPPWATHVLVDGCGGGGGAGGGPGGNTVSTQLSAGSGGGGARRAQVLTPLLGSPTSLDVVVGAGGAGGAGSNGGPSPAAGQPGVDGVASTVAYHDGSSSGVFLAQFAGGAKGGGGAITPAFGGAGVPNVVFTPGGHGPAGLFQSGIRTQLAPGPRQLLNLINSAGTITAWAAWPGGLYTDPSGQMDAGEGGASVAGDTVSSYSGAPSPEGFAGGFAGSTGTPVSGPFYGGAAGGGGGGGGFGPGGNGGNGGNASLTNASDGTAGTAAAANTGAGGGGGGCGGNGGAAPGNGKAGAGGGSGQVNLLFLAFPTTP